MPKLIKDHAIIDDSWQLIDKNDDQQYALGSLPSGQLILPLAAFNLLAEQLADRDIAVWLDSDESPSDIQAIEQATFIAINFPAFADGRGYSYAHKLRMQMQYQGELRAIGDVLQDQLFYLYRVGFNSFAMRADQNLEQSLERLKDFSISYQGAVQQPSPLFAQR